MKVIQKTGGYCTTVKEDETGCLQSVGLSVMDKVPNILVKSATKEGFETAKEGDSVDYSLPNSKTRRGRVGVAQTLDTQVNQSVVLEGFKIRRLTEIECERLQGFPDNWTKYGDFNGVIKEISRTQRYKMCGNAVTVDIIELIAKKLLKLSHVK